MNKFTEDLLIDIAESNGLLWPTSSTVYGHREETVCVSFVGSRANVKGTISQLRKEFNNMERVSYNMFTIDRDRVGLSVFWNPNIVDDPVIREEEPESTHVDEFIDMRTLASGIKVWRTGNLYSMAGSQFGVQYPDGWIDYIWSPPWYEMEEDEEYDKLIGIVEEKWKKGLHRPETVL